MKKTILYSSMSIDGYIAADGDNLNWLMAFYKSEDITIMGNRTYHLHFISKDIVDIIKNLKNEEGDRYLVSG
ncbi:MAG: hypothetical protein PF505_04325 [Vallitaleaceae bacterium]|jgi:hypothetical protein|nr:hypothetical protein [Vallitaleaceae bacterium]